MNHNIVILINSIILISLLIGVPTLFVGIVSLFKVKMNKVAKVFLYTFATGLILILGSVGFLSESIENLNSYFHQFNENNPTNTYSTTVSTFIKIGVVVGGAILGAILLVSIRLLSIRKNIELHSSHDSHSHNDHITNYSDIDCSRASKKVSIILLMSHRLIDGLSLGFMAQTDSNVIAEFESWGMIITFIIHLVPMSIIIYFTQYDISRNRLKAFGYSVLMLVITAPFVIVGAYTSSYLNAESSSVYWVLPFLYSASGIIMVILAVIELLPEFIHNKEMNTKTWYLCLLTLIGGIILGLLLLCIHSHSHSSEHHHENITNAFKQFNFLKV